MPSHRNHSPSVNLNLNVRGLPLSATLRINELSARLLEEGRKVARLGLGQSPFPVPASVGAQLVANAQQKDYLPVMGLRQLREAVTHYFHRTQGVVFSPEDVMVGPGSKELMFILQLVYYGDLVIPTPSWVSYAPQAEIIGRHIRWVPTRPENQWRISADQLEELCREDPDRPRLVILNYPANPSGTTYRVEDLRQIASIAQRYRVLLLSDEIYGGIHHTGQHVSVARFYPEGTLVSNGLSKWCGAGGWRLGVFAFPRSLAWLRDSMAAVASETFTSTSAPIQYAAVKAFEGGIRIEEYLRDSRRILRALGRHLWRRLAAAGVAVAEPKGAFYLFPDFSPFAEKLAARGIRTSTELCARLLEETGVAVLPGRAFGRPPAELTLRLSYVDFDGARALAAAAAVPPTEPLSRAFLEVHALGCLEAVERMCVWIDGG